MINKKSTPIILIVLAVASTVLFMKNKSMPQTKLGPLVLENEESVAEDIVVKKATPTVLKKMQFSSENLKKCADFLSEKSATNLEQTLQQIKTRFHLTEKLEITEYQLFGPNNEQIVVQNIPQEEMKNKIRVFKTAADGFPDRIKDFPNAAAGSIEDRLQGALTLGRLQLKIDKYQAISSSGTKLDYDKSENKITKINLSQGRTQLTCEQGQCSCERFR